MDPVHLVRVPESQHLQEASHTEDEHGGGTRDPPHQRPGAVRDVAVVKACDQAAEHDAGSTHEGHEEGEQVPLHDVASSDPVVGLAGTGRVGHVLLLTGGVG